MSSSPPFEELTVEISSEDVFDHYQNETENDLSSAIFAIAIDHCYSLPSETQFNTSDFKTLKDSCEDMECLNCETKSSTSEINQLQCVSFTNSSKEDPVVLMQNAVSEPHETCACDTMESDTVNQAEVDSNDPTTPTIPSPDPTLSLSISDDSAFGSHVSQEIIASESDFRKSTTLSLSTVSDATTSSKAKTKRLSVFEVLTRRKLARLQLNQAPTDHMPSSPPEQNLDDVISSSDTSTSIIKEVELNTPRRSLRHQKTLNTEQSCDQNQSSLGHTTSMDQEKGSGDNSTSHGRKHSLICGICDKSFDFPSELRRHLVMVHAEERAYRCKMMMKCKNMAFTQRVDLVRHVEKKHNKTHEEATKLVNKVAVEYLKPYYSLKRLNAIRQSKLHELVQITVLQKSKLAHMLSDGSQQGNIISGDKEGIGAGTITIPEKSVSGQEVEQRQMQIDSVDCGTLKPGTGTYTLRRRATRPRKCDKCNLRFASIHLLNRHLLSHIAVFPYKCQKCSKSFKRHDTFVDHLKRDHQSQPADALELAKKSAAKYLMQMRVHEAPEDIDFSRIHAAVTAAALKHAESAISIAGGSRTKGNNATNFGRKQMDKKRIKKKGSKCKKEKSFVCKICQKGFKRSHQLDYHSFNHTNERPFSCTKCKKGCRNISDLKRHIWTHLVACPFKCSICGDTKRNRWEVADHIQGKHRKSKEVAMDLANDAIVGYLSEVEMIDVPQDMPFSTINDILLCTVMQNENIAISDGLFCNKEVFKYVRTSKDAGDRMASNDLGSKSSGMLSVCASSSPSSSTVNTTESQGDALIDDESPKIHEDADDLDYVPDSDEDDEDEEVDD